MDCRTARTWIISDAALSADERDALEGHLAQCAACRDDRTDPFSRALAPTTFEMALPSHDFTTNLLKRLPRESPRELAQQATRQQRRRILGWLSAVAAVAAVLLVAGLALRPAWVNTTLGLAATTTVQVVQAAIGPLVTMLASSVVVGMLIGIVRRQPSGGRAMSAALLALLLLFSVGAVTAINDAANLANVAQTGAAATVTRGIRVNAPVEGSVVSLLGDLEIGSAVRGNVASLLGTVSLASEAAVGGDVLAGTGQLQAEDGQVAGVVRPSVGGLAAGQALLGSSVATLSPAVLRGLGALLGALVTLALAGLVVLLWPDRTVRTSQILPERPWAALGIGVLVTVLLVLLALPMLAFLAATVVGLLLVPVLLMAVHLPYVQGLAAVGQALGQRLTGTVSVGSALWGVAAQLVLVIGLGIFAPYAGLVTFYLLASLGLGARLLERPPAF